MERNIRLNWPVLVEEARRRRKAQGLTQQRLAALAGVSVPTVSRFESNNKNIELATALAILEPLGLLERSEIEFLEKTVLYDAERDVVLFLAETRNGEITCAVSGEALEDHYGATGRNRRGRVAAFHAYKREIQDKASEKLRSRRHEADGSILIRSRDIGIS